ncbi:hypothetical protein LINPERHAP1_LOCUS5806 [Linum perenne]
MQENFQSDDMESNRANTLKHMRSLWNKWRSTLNVKYVGNRSEEDAVKNLPPMWNKEDWEWCVKNVFMSEEYKKKSSTNKQNRRKHDDDEIPTVRHHNGSKPTRQIIYDMIEENGGEEPDLLAIFNRVYGQDGEVKDPGALAKRDKIMKKLEEDPNSNTIELIETAFGKQTHGSVAVLGGGVKPKDFKEKSEKKDEIIARLRQIEEEKSTLEKEMDEVKNAARIEAEQQKRRLDEMENQMVNMQSEMQAQMQAQMQAFMESQMQAFMGARKGI